MDAREEALLRDGAAILPTVILARLFGIKPLAVIRRREKLGISISLVQGKAVTSAFLRRMPDLTALPLTPAERRTIHTLRQEWCYKRKGDLDRLDRAYDIIGRAIRKIPTAAIAAILGETQATVVRLEKEMELQLERPERRKLEHLFASAESCPKLHFLKRAEREKLEEAWESASLRFSAALRARKERSEGSLEALLARLYVRKQELLLADQSLELRPCSGTCGQLWPRGKEFFIPSYRSPDGLGERCKYCTMLRKITARHSGVPQRKNKPQGRMLEPAERARVKQLLTEYSRILPIMLVRRLFRIGEGTLARLNHELGIALSLQEHNAVFWRWYFRATMPKLELMTESEIAKLYLLSKGLKESVRKRFERDEEHILALESERARCRAESLRRPDPPYEEKSCRFCKASYPPTSVFFRFKGKKQKPVCNVCSNYIRARGRWKILKRKYGEH